MRNPIVSWERARYGPTAADYAAGHVWGATLDDRYLVEVQRDPQYDSGHRGILLVWDHDDNMIVLLEESVGLAYGAQFGPDRDDVASWQVRALEVVDEET